tara:strand:+ start:2720 stop:3421 length:702 start_codon:yes stop_codon:yes gene_type:complete
MSNIVIPDGGNIGSASDPDAISIASNGKLTFSQGIANTGTIDAGIIGDSVVVPGATQVLLHDQTITSSTQYLDIEGKLSSTYLTYLLVGNAFQPVDDNKAIWLRFGSGSAGSVSWYTTGTYECHVMGNTSNSFTSLINITSETKAVIAGFGNQGNQTNEHTSFSTWIWGSQGDGTASSFTSGSINASTIDASGSFFTCIGGFLVGSDTAFTSLRLQYSSGNISVGNVKLYGYK